MSGKTILEKSSTAIQNAVEAVVLKVYSVIGGPAAVAHEKAAIESAKHGDVSETIKSASKLNSDIVSHIAGRDIKTDGPHASRSNTPPSTGERIFVALNGRESLEYEKAAREARMHGQIGEGLKQGMQGLAFSMMYEGEAVANAFTAPNIPRGSHIKKRDGH